MPSYGPIHKLEVTLVGDGGEFEAFTITHAPECQLVEADRYWRYACGVEANVENAGLKFSLEYSDTPITKPGEYRIRAWSDVYHHFEGDEYDGGIALVIDAGTA